MKEVTNFKSCLKAVPDILVSCRYNGEDNALAVEYAGNCSFNPPMVMVGIVPSRYSYKMVKESGVFVVNLVGENQKEQYAYLGSHSRRNEDKLKNSGMKIKEAVKINAPVLEDCPVSIECEVVDSILTGSHEMFIGKVLHVHAKEEYIKDDGSIDFSKIKLLKFRD